jgi:hypothetical protein
MLIKIDCYYSPNYFSHREGKQKMIKNSTHGSTFEGYIPLLGIVALLYWRTKDMQEWNSFASLCS